MTDIDRIARVVHEAVRALQIDDGHDPVPAWGYAPEWMRDSTREGVQAAINVFGDQLHLDDLLSLLNAEFDPDMAAADRTRVQS